MLTSLMVKHLRCIMSIRRWQYRRNVDILKQAGLPSMYDMLIQKNLHWAGRVIRIENIRFPRQIRFSQLPSGDRSRGHPKLRFKVTVKRHLTEKGSEAGDWYTLAQYRSPWREMINISSRQKNPCSICVELSSFTRKSSRVCNSVFDHKPVVSTVWELSSLSLACFPVFKALSGPVTPRPSSLQRLVRFSVCR